MSEVRPPPIRASDGSGLPVALAALAVVESLIVILVERQLIDAHDLEEAMQGAIDSHLHAEPAVLTQDDHRAAARVIQKFRQGANSVRASARI